MFLVCPKCLRAATPPGRQSSFECSPCRRRWDAPAPAFRAAYHASSSELDAVLVSEHGGEFSLANLPAVVGRDTDFAELENNLAVSRQHCRFDYDARSQTFTVCDLGSGGGTRVNDSPAPPRTPTPIQPGDVLRLSGFALRLELRLRRPPGGVARTRSGSAPVVLPAGVRHAVLSLGAGSSIGVVPEGEPTAESLAVVWPSEATGEWTLLPLRREAVRVNGAMIVEQQLRPFDQVTLAGGSYVFHAGEGVLQPHVVEQGCELAVKDVAFLIGDREILSGLTCRIPAGRLTAIVGPSGCGKSTLLRVLSASSLASIGTLTVDGKALSSGEYTAWARNNLAMVPQSDIVHPELTVRQCLDYAAALRLGPLVSRREKGARVGQLLDELELTPHAGTRIDRLSGGQRKRVNVAVELIRSPSLVLLDEPTSGLDYHMEATLVALLRRLSRQGRTVVFVTHSLPTLAEADHVILLDNDGSGGRVLVEGVPAAVLERVHHEQQRPLPAAPDRTQGQGFWPRLTGRMPRVAPLTMRYAQQWMSSLVPSLLSLFLLPLLLGLLVRIAVTKDRIGTDQMLFGLIAAFWLGMNQSVREIVRERDIFLREHAARIGALSVLLSKLIFFAAITLPQAVLLKGYPETGQSHKS